VPLGTVSRWTDRSSEWDKGLLLIERCVRVALRVGVAYCVLSVCCVEKLFLLQGRSRLVTPHPPSVSAEVEGAGRRGRSARGLRHGRRLMSKLGSRRPFSVLFFPQKKKKDGGKAAHPLVLTVRRAQENRPTRLLVCKGMNPCSLPQFSSSSSVRKLTEKEVKKRGKDETIDATVLVAKLAIACASLFGVVSFGPSWLAGRARGAGYFSQREKESPLLVEATPSVEV